jgi:hypothetical protein
MKVEALKAFGSLLIALLLSAAAFAQAPVAVPLPSADTTTLLPHGSITVYLRTEDGQPLPQRLRPTMGLFHVGSNAPLDIPVSMAGEGWQFEGVAAGADYEVRVEVEGYQPGREIVRLPNAPARRRK